ncbi:unnamed protein product [Calicophoron daubneyi]|uniref:Transient receptor ion channel domain-containing protein n=1 Tax=Calicophoron daubneyi TaxID=300641 RepID=A0AAV2TBZ4_CALDB
MSGAKNNNSRRRYAFADVVDTALFQHRATVHSAAADRSWPQYPPRITGVTRNLFTRSFPPTTYPGMPGTVRRISSRKAESGKLLFRGLGKVEEDDVRKEVNDLIKEVENDLSGHRRIGKERRGEVIDLGGLELPMEEGELTRIEKLFLHAVDQGDLATVKDLVDRAEQLKLNPNCTDALGRDALRIVIENEHLELLELLVTIPQIDLKDSILHAINEDNIPAVEVILQAEAERGSKKNLKGFLGRIQSSSFTPDITPIILAAHRDNYVILKMLLDRGDRIAKPHALRCACHLCSQARRTDGLQHSKLRINTYRALTSPSFIILTSNDPILTAFEMSWELSRLGELENEFRTEYEELAEKCSEFATALLAETRSTVELSVILNHDTGDGRTGGHVAGLERSEFDSEGNDRQQLARLKLAIRYEQKKFVAHPHCQQLLASMWYDGLPGFRQKPVIAQMITMATFCFMFPIIATCYMLAPQSKMGTMMKKPFIKFLCHSSSYMSFIGLLLLSAVRIESLLMNTMNERMNDRGPLPSLSEAAVILYVIGYVWQEVKQIYTWGVRTYVTDSWHLLDFVMHSMYISTITMRTVAWIRVSVYNEPRFVNRGQWDSFDPILISECLFAAANIISTLKLVQVFTISPQLGPLQISIGRMLFDIFKFFCVYALVLVAFAFGLNQLFWFYANNRARNCKRVHFTLEEGQKDVYDYCITRGTHFTNLFEIVQSLYWSAYGLIDLTSFNLEYPHAFTEFVGKLTFGVYSYIAFIVLLNMLIAMMNSSYEQIVGQVDVEWKFARSKLWISYFAEGCTVPVPFNIIPTPKSCTYMVESVKKMCAKWFREDTHKSEWETIRDRVKHVKGREARYLVVMRELTKRYVMKKLRTAESNTVDADDLNEIKCDISAFRFELMDILKANGMAIPDVHKRKAKLRRGREGFQLSDYEDINWMKENLKETRSAKKTGIKKDVSPVGSIKRRSSLRSTVAYPTGHPPSLAGGADNLAFSNDELAGLEEELDGMDQPRDLSDSAALHSKSTAETKHEDDGPNADSNKSEKAENDVNTIFDLSTQQKLSTEDHSTRETPKPNNSLTPSSKMKSESISDQMRKEMVKSEKHGMHSDSDLVKTHDEVRFSKAEASSAGSSSVVILARPAGDNESSADRTKELAQPRVLPESLSRLPPKVPKRPALTEPETKRASEPEIPPIPENQARPGTVVVAPDFQKPKKGASKVPARSRPDNASSSTGHETETVTDSGHASKKTDVKPSKNRKKEHAPRPEPTWSRSDIV